MVLPHHSDSRLILLCLLHERAFGHAIMYSPAPRSNVIVDPINRGLDADSNPHDVAIMRKRAHVLHRLVNAFVDRKTDSILRQFLPFKREVSATSRARDRGCPYSLA